MITIRWCNYALDELNRIWYNTDMETTKKYFEEFERLFHNEQICIDYLYNLRWKNGWRCPRCSHNEHWKVGDMKYKCKECGYQSTIISGTLLQRSHLSISKWLRSTWYVANETGCANALEMQNMIDLGSYHTALSVLNKLRTAISRCEKPKLKGTVIVDDVFIKSEEYTKLRSLLLAKKNIILQGAPGVGKTYSAKRLAYSIIGEEDRTKVEFIQFHQNYSYEDFVMGYKPKEDGGFELRRGVFYNFCRKAQSDPDKKYFFIIDEINRGNMSKIFGELLMLIENDYRGEKHKIRLAYNDEYFSVPENLYIIGMMNTADRSLAMIDYALRRRFSFFDMTPGFDSVGFKKYQENLDCEVFNKVIDAVKALNIEIAKDDSLGKGFCIGHSYFCNRESIDNMWLENVIEYDIAPMLREYWFDNDKKFKEETDKLLSLIK